MSKQNIRLTPKSFLRFGSRASISASLKQSTPGKRVRKLVKEVIQLLIRVFEAPLAYLFGRDIFISYARKDSANYAQQLAIDLREQVPKLSFYLDQWASLSGTTLPPSLKRALRWSRLLVFIGTQNAIASPSVRLELEVFSRKKGRFVPIDVDDALGKAILKDQFLRLCRMAVMSP